MSEQNPEQNPTPPEVTPPEVPVEEEQVDSKESLEEAFERLRVLLGGEPSEEPEVLDPSEDPETFVSIVTEAALKAHAINGVAYDIHQALQPYGRFEDEDGQKDVRILTILNLCEALQNVLEGISWPSHGLCKQYDPDFDNFQSILEAQEVEEDDQTPEQDQTPEEDK